VLGFRLKENFDAPYVAQSMTEFWRRWHISLTTWIRDYLYLPLGGNRAGNARRHRRSTGDGLCAGDCACGERPVPALHLFQVLIRWAGFPSRTLSFARHSLCC
jgi:D-alanyl-lipoteichoic acid acyltransferase DltB (MBOAT superfamily)